MSKIKSLLYPALQRARYAGFAAAFEKAKKLPMNSRKILMYSTSKGKLGGNLLAIKNYIEKNELDYEIKVVTSLDPMAPNALAARNGEEQIYTCGRLRAARVCSAAAQRSEARSGVACDGRFQTVRLRQRFGGKEFDHP